MSNQPVAWHYPDGKPDQCTTNKAYAEMEPAWTPMYYKHEWVGLTDEEIELIYAVTIKIRKKDIMPGEQKMFARTIQEFLRKKNT